MPEILVRHESTETLRGKKLYLMNNLLMRYVVNPVQYQS